MSGLQTTAADSVKQSVPAGPILALVSAWLAEAESLRSWGGGGLAEVLERASSQLEQLIEELGHQQLTLKEASELSGYSTDHLSRLVRDGRIPNAGKHGAPRIKCVDLPRKPVGKSTSQSHVDSKQIVQSIINRGD